MRKAIYALGIALAALAALAAATFYTAAGQDALFQRAAKSLMAQTSVPIEGIRVVVCGSASPFGNSPARAQACIAVLTAEHFFVFDVGARSPLRIAQARLPVARIDGVFLTHFHSDHISGLPDVNLGSWVQGRKSSLPVYGPPGIESVIDGFNLAYRLDNSYRVAHHGPALLPPAAGPMTARVITPGEVAWQDGGLTIRSFRVNHDPIEPAVGYRVDYAGRSVVISGDTVATHTLFAAAKDADLLLHDALARHLVDPMIAAATEAGIPALPAIMTDVIDYHADSRELEDRAAAAGVGQLVLYHLIPTPPNALAENMFTRGLSPDTLLARDLQSFDLPPHSTEIIIREP